MLQVLDNTLVEIPDRPVLADEETGPMSSGRAFQAVQSPRPQTAAPTPA